jgi:hypothetical protein
MAMGMRRRAADRPAPFGLGAAERVSERWENGSSGSADECMTIFMRLPTATAGRWALRSVPAREIAKAARNVDETGVRYGRCRRTKKGNACRFS